MKKRNGFKEMVKALLESSVQFYTLENVIRESTDEVLGECPMHEIYLCKEGWNKKGKKIDTLLCMRYRQEESGTIWLEGVFDTGIYWEDAFKELSLEVFNGINVKLTFQYGG